MLESPVDDETLIILAMYDKAAKTNNHSLHIEAKQRELARDAKNV